MNKIKDLREDKDLTQLQLSKILNIARTTLNSYELEKAEPSFEILYKLSDFFDVTIDYLLGRTNNPKNENLTKGLTTEEIKELKKYKEMLILYRNKNNSPTL